MLKFILNKKLKNDETKNLNPESYSDSVLMAMGLPYLEANAFDLFNAFTLTYGRKAKNNDWKEDEYQHFLSHMDSYYNSFSNRSFLANPINLYFNLKEDWGIKNRESALSILDWLRYEGHRSFFHKVFQWREALKNKELEIIKDFLIECIEDEIDIPYFSLEIDELNFDDEELKNSSFYNELEYNLMCALQYENQMTNCGILAWDMARFVNLVRNCKSARYINTKEAWDYIRSVKDLCFENFNSWQEFTLSFKIGRKYWLRGTRSNFYPENYCEDFLTNPLYSWSYFQWEKRD